MSRSRKRWRQWTRARVRRRGRVPHARSAAIRIACQPCIIASRSRGAILAERKAFWRIFFFFFAFFFLGDVLVGTERGREIWKVTGPLVMIPTGYMSAGFIEMNILGRCDKRNEFHRWVLERQARRQPGGGRGGASASIDMIHCSVCQLDPKIKPEVGR